MEPLRCCYEFILVLKVFVAVFWDGTWLLRAEPENFYP